MQSGAINFWKIGCYIYTPAYFYVYDSKTVLAIRTSSSGLPSLVLLYIIHSANGVAFIVSEAFIHLTRNPLIFRQGSL